MPFIRNDSTEPQRGPFFDIPPGEVVEVSGDWLRSRDDRVRRGQFAVVEAPVLPPIEVDEPAPTFSDEEE